MKKIFGLLIVCGLIGYFSAFAPTVRAEGNFWLRLMGPNDELINTQQTAAVMNTVGVIKTADTITDLTSIDTKVLKDVPVQNKTVTLKNIVPTPESAPDPAVGGCGQTMTPAGKINETIRCDGRNWVAAANLLNDGKKVSIGPASVSNQNARLYVNNDNANQSFVSIIAAKNSGNFNNALFGSVNGENSIGVVGSASGAGAQGVEGRGSYAGVSGYSDATSGAGIGVYGQSEGQTELASGVLGVAGQGTGVSGRSTTGFGVWGFSHSGNGILGLTNSENSDDSFGQAGIRGDGPIGVKGVASLNMNIPNAIGVLGTAVKTGDTAVKARADSAGSIGFSQVGSNSRNSFEGSVNVGYLGTGPSDISTVKVQVDGGVKILPSRAQNPCTATLRGTFWFTTGDPGVADSAEVCAKNADGSYAWKNLF
jgi:hypothetical protein